MSAMRDGGAALLALAERAEKASGPDRDLDLAIAGAINHAILFYKGEHTARPFTSSLDAALTLVPEGLAWTLGQNVHRRYWVASTNTLTEEGEPQSTAWGQHRSSACLALCAAALRASFPSAAP